MFSQRKNCAWVIWWPCTTDWPHQWMREELWMGVGHLDFCKAFEVFPLNILVSEWERYGFDGWNIKWIRNWTDCSFQRIAINCILSISRSVTSGVPQRCVLRPVLINIFITRHWGWADTQQVCKLSNAVDSLAGRIQRDLFSLEE